MTMAEFIPRAQDALEFFAFTFAELTVLFIGISFLVGLGAEFIPPERTKSLLSSRRGRGYLVGAGLGALTPFCSCSTIPLMVGMLRAGAGFGPTLSFLFASPLVNPVILGLFCMTFGVKATLMYSAWALFMSILVSLLLDRFNFQRFVRQDVIGESSNCGESLLPAEVSACVPDYGDSAAKPSVSYGRTAPFEGEPCDTCARDLRHPLESGPVPNRWRKMFFDAVKQFLTFLPHITVGVAVGAIAHGFVPSEMISRFAGPENPLAVPVSAVIGVPLYVRVSTMIPISMALLSKGMSIGAVVALIVGGAGASLPEVVLLNRIFRWPVMSAFLVSVFVIAVTTGWVFNAFF